MIPNKKFTYFHAGDIVQLKQDLPNKPVMIVKKVSKARITESSDKSLLLGIVCFWFTDSGLYQEQSFSTKDLTNYA